MPEESPINPYLKNLIKPAVTATASATDFPDFNKLGYFAVVFMALLTAMQIRETTVATESKSIGLNASLQNYLNRRNASIKFSVLTPKAGNPTIDRVQDDNQNYSALRENIQNLLITARQNAQVMMTKASTDVNILEQDSSENSGWLQMLYTIFQVIDTIASNRRG